MFKIKNKIFFKILSAVFSIQFSFLITLVYAISPTPPEGEAPFITDITASGITANSVSISWNTNRPADSLVEYGTTTDYVSGTTLNALSTSLVTSHSQTLTGLTENTLYSYRVKSKNEAGNIGVSQYFTFVTSSLSGSSLTISTVAASSITTTGATITWATKKLATFGLRNQNSDTQVEYGVTTSYGSSTTLNTEMVSNHSQTLSGLTPNTLYHYRVKSKDAEGNLAVSGDFTFTTIDLPKTTLPPTPVPPTPVVQQQSQIQTQSRQTQPQQQTQVQPLFISLRGPFYIGQRAEEVKNLQTMLSQDKTIYPEGIISGYYDFLTVKAVQKFQEKYNIARSGKLGYGIAGPKTRAKLNELYASKSSQADLSEEVKAKIKIIQEQIKNLMIQLIQMLQEEIHNKISANR